MTDKEFRRLNRMELIDMIRLLRESEAQLKSENDALREQLADRRTRLDNAGSIAEAILSLSGIAETAQTAADDYLAEIRAMHAEAERKLADAEANADNLIKSALRRATEIIAEAARRSAPPEDADEVTEDVPDDTAEPPSDEPDEIEEHADES